MKPSPKISEIHIVSCCNFKFSSEWHHEAIKTLLVHIKKEHKALYSKLEKRGRLKARSQNGCGYFDDKNLNGWVKAQQTFKDAWIGHALEEYLHW